MDVAPAAELVQTLEIQYCPVNGCHLLSISGRPRPADSPFQEKAAQESKRQSHQRADNSRKAVPRSLPSPFFSQLQDSAPHSSAQQAS